jgi:predicted nucleic acid-binding Zn finger protein
MTAKEIQKRNAKAESLRVLQADDGSFYVESEKGKILYNVVLDDEETSCTCGDFAKNIKKDSNFRCKHILSVMNAIPKQEIENAKFCEKHVPKLDDRFITSIKNKDFVLYVGVLDLATQRSWKLSSYNSRPKKMVMKQYAVLWLKENMVRCFQISAMLIPIIAIQ